MGRKTRPGMGPGRPGGAGDIQDLGRPIIELTPEQQQRWEEAVRPILEEYVEQAESKGLPGGPFLLRLLSLIDEWQTKTP